MGRNNEDFNSNREDVIFNNPEDFKDYSPTLRGRVIPYNPEYKSHEHAVHMIPTEVAARYMQVDRTTPEGNFGNSRENIDNLKKSINEKGWTTAITIAHDKENNWGAIIEGNHRLQAAKELGATHIPAMVHTAGYPEDGYSRTPRRGAPLHADTTEQLPRHDFVNPKQFKELR